MLQSFLASPARVFPCCPHVRTFTLSEASVPRLPRSCVCWSLLLWSFTSIAVVFMKSSYSFTLHQPVLDLALLPGTLVTVARSHYFAPLRVFSSGTKHVSSALSSRCSRISPSRGTVQGLVCVPPSPVRARLLARLLRSFSKWFRCVSDVAVASPRLLQAHPFVEASSPRECPAHFAVSPAVGGLTRVAQTFCHIRDAWLVLLFRTSVLCFLLTTNRQTNLSHDGQQRHDETDVCFSRHLEPPRMRWKSDEVCA